MDREEELLLNHLGEYVKHVFMIVAALLMLTLGPDDVRRFVEAA